MNVRRRGTEGGVSGVSSVGKPSKNIQCTEKVVANRPEHIKNSIGLEPTAKGYSKIKGTVSG